MLDGVYQNPTKIIFGKGSEKTVGEEVTKYSRNILLHYGSTSFNQTSIGENIRNSLSEFGIKYTELGGVQANPNADLVYEGIALCRQENIDFILAVGGASVIDSAKAIAIGAQDSGDFFDFFEGSRSPCKSLNVGVILTISGAGSESSNAAVITKKGKKYSCGTSEMFPSFAILNPELTYTVPDYLTACGVVDSISHVLERYFSNTPCVETSSRLCEGLINTLMMLGEKVKTHPLNYDVRAELMWAAKLAHDNTAGFGRKQDWATHTIAHEIGARYEQAHGAILAVLFPAWMKFVYTENKALFLQFSERIFGINSSSNDTDEIIHLGIQSYQRFLSNMGMPSSLSELGLTDRVEFKDIASACCRTTQSGTIGNFTRLDQSDIVKLLTLCA